MLLVAKLLIYFWSQQLLSDRQGFLAHLGFLFALIQAQINFSESVYQVSQKHVFKANQA